jgi:hypothetical protein
VSRVREAFWAGLLLLVGFGAPLAYLLATWMVGALFVMVELGLGLSFTGNPLLPAAFVVAAVLVAGGAGVILTLAYHRLRPSRLILAATLPLAGFGGWLGYLALRVLLSGVNWA